MSAKPPQVVVSVLCTTFNHRDYIREALDSMLAQETDFAFEILINDDHSTDGTTEIIKEYQAKYPDIVKPVFHSENQYSKGVRHMMGRFLLPKAAGEYIAICEGDDYWTDPQKLQIQVDFMEKHPDYTVCFHPVQVIYEGLDRESHTVPEETSGFTTMNLLNHNFIQTNSVMYRRQDYKNLAQNMMPGDLYMHLYHAQFGKIGFINRVMAAYRRHPGGLWWDSATDMDLIWSKFGLNWLALYEEFLKMFGDDAAKSKLIRGQIITLMHKLATLDKQNNTDSLFQAVGKFPTSTEIYIADLGKEVSRLKSHSDKQAKIIDHYANISQRLETENEHLRRRPVAKIKKATLHRTKRKAT